MNALFEAEFCLRLVLTLGHFLWQGALIGLIVLAAGRVLRKRSAKVRYGINLVALLAMPVCAAVTFSLLKIDVDLRDGFKRSPVELAVVTNSNAQIPAATELAIDRPESESTATSDWDRNRADETVAPVAVAPRTGPQSSRSRRFQRKRLRPRRQRRRSANQLPRSSHR